MSSSIYTRYWHCHVPWLFMLVDCVWRRRWYVWGKQRPVPSASHAGFLFLVVLWTSTCSHSGGGHDCIHRIGLHSYPAKTNHCLWPLTSPGAALTSEPIRLESWTF